MHIEPIDHGVDLSVAAAALRGRGGLAWLDGGGGLGDEGRWSFLACDPVEIRRSAFGDAAPLAALVGVDEPVVRDAGHGVEGPEAEAARVAPRFIGYIAYDAAWSGTTRTPRRLARDPTAPILWLGRYDAVVAVDHHAARAFVVGDNRRACRRLLRRISGPATPPVARAWTARVDERHHHRHAVEAALDHIARGDIYQVNLARRWVASFEGDGLALWLAMRRASPVPLGMFLDTGEQVVLARTMERFLEWEGPGQMLRTRPIKGTIARSGRDDDGEAQRLLGDDKERAEHAMIVDLMRNDLSRVAVTGSVRVPVRMVVEPYAGLQHLVSTVSCRTRPDVRLPDLLTATFPPGSVTGAPKLRAIEIIESLEAWPRGVYTGAVGLVRRDGSAAFAVAIRTAVVRGGQATYFAGGGLVSASVAEREIAETELKARVFTDAVATLGP